MPVGALQRDFENAVAQAIIRESANRERHT